MAYACLALLGALRGKKDKNKRKIDVPVHKKFIIQLVLKIISHLNNRHLSFSLTYCNCRSIRFDNYHLQPKMCKIIYTEDYNLFQITNQRPVQQNNMENPPQLTVTGLSHSIELHFIVPHGCCIFYKVKARLSNQPKDHDSLYCGTRFIAVVWN